MISKTTDVQSYIDEVPAGRKPAIEKLRKLCKQHLRGYQECIEYGMPVYKLNGELQIAFASRRQYIAIYVTNEIADEFRSKLPQCKIGKGCVRFTKPEKIDFDVVKQMLSRTPKQNLRCAHE